MKIAMVLERQFPFDERVEKEALSLIENGHTVYIISFNYDKLPVYELYKGIHIVRFPISRKAYNKLSPLHRLQPFYKWIWIVNIKRFLKTHKIDAIHIHDLPLANVGYYFKKRIGCELVLDQHELWSETVKHYRHYNTFIGKLVRYFSRWACYEKHQFKNADYIITVEAPIKEWYIDNTATVSEKIYVVPNTTSKNQISDLDFPERKSKNEFVLYYAGKIDVNRCIDTVIKSLRIIKEKIPEIKFKIAGKCARGYNPDLLAKKYQVEKLVKYFGELSFKEMIINMRDADICICLAPINSEEMNRTIATKIYQYIQLERPMIVSRTTYMKLFVEQHDIGSVVNETSPESFARAVIEMYSDRKILKRYSGNSKKIKADYVWEITSKPLIALYSEINK